MLVIEKGQETNYYDQLKKLSTHAHRGDANKTGLNRTSTPT